MCVGGQWIVWRGGVCTWFVGAGLQFSHGRDDQVQLSVFVLHHSILLPLLTLLSLLLQRVGLQQTCGRKVIFCSTLQFYQTTFSTMI